MINKELLDILACPQCKGTLQLNEQKDGLICEACKLLYEIRDDIPVMLTEEAKKIATTQEIGLFTTPSRVHPESTLT